MMSAPHVELGLPQGLYRYQEMWGLYEVRGFGPHLWLSVAKGLGYHMHTVCIKDEGFRQILLASGFSPQLAKWRAYYRCHLDLYIFFLGVALMPLLGNVRYWATWLVTHVFVTTPDYAHPRRGDRMCAQRFLTIGTWVAPLCLGGSWSPGIHRSSHHANP